MEVYQRVWKTMSDEQTDSAIIVTSYNLLATTCAFRRLHPHASNEVLDFGYRGPRIVKEINESQSDIIALQELDQTDFYLPAFKEAGYDCEVV